MLPKVQVSASVKEPYVHQPDKTKPFDLNGEISATYTAGGGATGTAYARLYVSCQWWQYQRNVPSAKESDLTSDGYKLVTTTEPQDLVDGASKFTFSGIAASEALQCLGQYNTQFHAATLRVEAYVYEVTSGKTTKETVDVPLRYGQLYDMSVLSSYQYMPGRPYNLRAKVTLPDGSPAPAGVTFYMKIIRTAYVREAYNDDEGSQNEILPVTTSGDGTIVLDVDTNDSADSCCTNAGKKTRKFFPETWIFSSAYLGESTSGAFRTTVPDTMTTWMLHSYGISSSGLSLGSAISNLTVAKPLYVRASLPYSVLRDEVATIRVGVFNGKSSAANVELNVAAASASSDALKILCVDGSASTSGDSANGCRSSLQVAPSSSAVFVVQVQALAIGVQRIVTSATSTDGLTDTIEQQLLVEPPGETEEIPLNEMLMLDASSESSTKEVKMETIVPTGAIAPRFVFSATGDIMGPSMEGIENLLQVPYGCGEQNMISLAPNVYVLDYLKATSAEGDPVYTRALSQGTANMAKGYQRQLQYMHSDGSFSAFGEQSACGCGFGDVRAEGANEENKAYGSTWLTAFVLRVFAGVSKYTYVDESILNKAKDYLLSVQKSDGSFEERGRVIHQEMMGGVADKELSLTAYVLLSLAEAGAGIVTDAPTSTAQLVSQRVGSATGGYGVAIGAYALQAACKTWGSQMCTLANSAQQALDKIKVQGGGGVHWVGGTGEAPSSKAEPVQEDMRIAMFAPPRTKSSDVETTAYALLSVTRSQQNDLANLVATGMAVVRWLSNQRNGQGGFRSTQDTVVALQALSSYSMATSSLAGAHALEVDFAAPIVGSLLPKKITIDDSTSKVLQRFDLDSKTVPIAADGSIKFELSASGKGVALVQLVLRYNKLGKAADNPSYTIDVTWRPTSPIVNLTSAKRRSGESQYPAKANVTACFAPTSEIKNDPGMTLVRVQAFSGYEFDADALQELTEMPGSIVQRADVDAKGADLYVDSQARGYSFREKICLTLPANKAHDVSGLGPATASVQAYYNPETKAAISTESKALLDTKSSGDGGSGHPVSVGGEPVTTRAPYIPPEKPPPVPTSGAQNLRWFVAATAVVIGVLFA